MKKKKRKNTQQERKIHNVVFNHLYTGSNCLGLGTTRQND